MSEIRIAGLSEELQDILSDVQSGDFVKFDKLELTDDSGSESEEDGESEDHDDDDDDDDERGVESGDERESGIESESDDEEDDVQENESESDAEMQDAEQDASQVNGAEDEDAAEDADGSIHSDQDEDDEENDDAGDRQDDASTDSEAALSTKALYYVTRIESDGICTDFKLTKLELGITDLTDKHRYQVYGDEIHFPHDQHCSGTKCEHTISVSELAAGGSLEDYTITVNPGGDFMRRNVLGLRNCPVNCADGFLGRLNDISRYVPNSTFFTLASKEHEPICPVCIGLDVLQFQQALKADVENMTNFDTLFDRQFQLTTMYNARRHVTHYEFLQFDERELGMMFEDMQDEGEDDEGDDGGNSGWQTWAEAMDPNAALRARPAKDETIENLPRKPLCELKHEIPGERQDGENIKCHVCIGELEEDEEVVQLPCKHVFHGDECIGMWLRQQKTCPVCRREIE